MKLLKTLVGAALLSGVLTVSTVTWAAEHGHEGHNSAKAKPYPLKTCLVSGEKLGGMGEAYVFTHEGQEIKLCCKGCLPEFKKDPAKFLKKIQEAEKKAK